MRFELIILVIYNVYNNSCTISELLLVYHYYTWRNKLLLYSHDDNKYMCRFLTFNKVRYFIYSPENKKYIKIILCVIIYCTTDFYNDIVVLFLLMR